MNRRPAARQTARVAPTVVAPTGALRVAQTARSTRRLARDDTSKRSSSSCERPTLTFPSRTPIVAGTAPASRTRRSDLEPYRNALARREAVRARVVSRATTGRRSGGLPAPRPNRRNDHGIAPSLATQRAAAVRRELGYTDDEPGGKRVGRAGRVERPRVPDGRKLCLVLPQHARPARAPLHDGCRGKAVGGSRRSPIPARSRGSRPGRCARAAP